MIRQLRDLSEFESRALCRRDGLVWRVGPFLVRLISPLPDVVHGVRFLYQFAELPPGQTRDLIADFHVSVLPTCAGLRRSIAIDGHPVYPNVTRSVTIPTLEWTLNLCVFQHCREYLTIHAAVIERDGQVLLLPALSGSGKSTLCAALMHRGWRLFSDEVALIDLQDNVVHPVPRAVSLKESSIELIRHHFPSAVMGPVWPGTTKGRVAHVVAPPDSVRQQAIPGRPRWIVFPAFQRGSSVSLTPVSKAKAMMRTADESFNFSVLGKPAFLALARLIDGCDCFEFRYGGDLDEAIRTFDRLAHAEASVAASH